MTATLETRVDGDANSCRTAAGNARDAHRALCDAETGVHDARFTAGDSWHGDGGKAFRASATTAGQYISDVAAKMHAVSAALTDFAGELDVVKSQMADARSAAAASGLTVVGTQIQLPTGPAADSPAVTAGWADVSGMVADARRKESSAHSSLAAALSQAAGDGVIEKALKFLGFLPQDGSGVHVGNWIFGLGGLAFGAGTSLLVTTRYGRFQPRINGRFATPEGLGFWERFRAGMSPSRAGTPIPTRRISAATGRRPASGGAGSVSSSPPVSPPGTSGRRIPRTRRSIRPRRSAARPRRARRPPPVRGRAPRAEPGPAARSARRSAPASVPWSAASWAGLSVARSAPGAAVRSARSSWTRSARQPTPRPTGSVTRRRVWPTMGEAWCPI